MSSETVDPGASPEPATPRAGRPPPAHPHPRGADRRRALDALYQADVTGAAPVEVLREWRDALEEEVPEFTRQLVEGVGARLEELDRLIGAHAQGWTVPRMASVDRTILRVAVFELLYRPDVPPSVAISEAVEAAAQLSTEGSARFVNGILGHIAREVAGEAHPQV